tara:strand:- start:345 stop:509 length:165 start_codon:yes stop_codon:yes gene_type:complete
MHGWFYLEKKFRWKMAGFNNDPDLIIKYFKGVFARHIFIGWDEQIVCVPGKLSI